MLTVAIKLTHLLLGRKARTNLDSILRSRDITLLTEVQTVKAMVFPVVMYGCECWTIKNVECWKIDAFKLWCWRRLLRVPWTARRSNQSILKEINLNNHWKDWCWSLSSNTLTTWWEEPTHWKRLWCWERLRARGEGGSRGWLNEPELEQTPGDSEGQGSLACYSSGCRLSNWTSVVNWPGSSPVSPEGKFACCKAEPSVKHQPSWSN